MVEAEVAVVGAGPAGSAAAITLARAGRRVVLLDRAHFPRDKCCGDGLTAAALRRLEALGLEPARVQSWHRVGAVSVRSPSGRVSVFPLPRGSGTYAAVARRRDLDAALTDLARQAGASVLEGREVSGVDPAPEGLLVLRSSNGPVSTRFVVAADGAWSRMRKAAGEDHEAPYLGEWHAMRHYFSAVASRARESMWVWFEPELLPGYAWSFPLPGGGANVGLGVVRRPGQRMGALAERWSTFLGLAHVREVLGPEASPEQGAPRSWPIPARHAALSAFGGRVLFAGDAARQADPMTGEGIAQALEGGVLAAESIIGAGAGAPYAAAHAYEKRARRAIGADNAIAGALSRILRYPVGARAAVTIAGANQWTRAQFGRWLMEDYPRGIVLTPRRWSRSAVRRPGPYS